MFREKGNETVDEKHGGGGGSGDPKHRRPKGQPFLPPPPPGSPGREAPPCPPRSSCCFSIFPVRTARVEIAFSWGCYAGENKSCCFARKVNSHINNRARLEKKVPEIPTGR